MQFLVNLTDLIASNSPSMRKVRDGEEKKEKKDLKREKMTEIMATNVVASRSPYSNQL